ncbi:DUF47 family protein [Desulfovibrio sp. OttesenSCG-928-A18]|nr:DUF47 family protein [Desulfovibrio sp. OttesenSCG-928-A18]
MAVRLPFFGLVSMRSPLRGFLEHYEQIARGMRLIEESMECYITGAGSGIVCKDFALLRNEVDAAEEKADQIKRYIRNHLPRNIFLPVEKHLFFSYTRHQDDILNAGQDAMNWLAMRDVIIPEVFQRELIFFLGEVSKSVQMLRPAIEHTIAWVEGEGVERNFIKQYIRSLRAQHKKVTESMHELSSKLFCSDMDFKDIYQLINFVEYMHKMSHSAEKSVDLLRVMIAK